MIEIDVVASVWYETTITARKSHRCSCCFSEIKPGEKYLKHWSIFDGAARPGKLCQCCEADRDAFGAEHNGILAHPAGLIDILFDCIADGDEESGQKWKPMVERIGARRSAV